MKEFAPPRVSRDQFGPGRLGGRVFELISDGTRCESGKVCDGQNLATGSLDFDAGGEGDCVLVCGDCQNVEREELLRETQDRPTALGYNGFGRA
ncbi:hypothetical protein C4577_04825 [Candidatus Parcubacteria bacterium]|nr:MAG: hypothetical protein C4577_04825 [Candidatus Parcubacteria bacterium]